MVGPTLAGWDIRDLKVMLPYFFPVLTPFAPILWHVQSQPQRLKNTLLDLGPPAYTAASLPLPSPQGLAMAGAKNSDKCLLQSEEPPCSS